MKILVTGSVAYDLLLSHDGIFTHAIDPQALEHLSVNYIAPRIQRHHGGTAANISWNLRLLGQSPLMVGTVGGDSAEYRELLLSRGIPLDHVEVRQGSLTATAIIASDERENQISFYAPGADGEGHWPDLSHDLADCRYAIVSPRNPVVMSQAARDLHARKIPFVFDPGQAVHAFSAQELQHITSIATGLVLNAYEWSLFSDISTLSISDALELTDFLIITMGETGLAVHTSEAKHTIPACRPTTVVNPTGAGDALRAGLLTGLSHGWSLEDSARLGASVASFVVEQEGALLDSLDVKEVRSRAEKTYGAELPRLVTR